MGSNQWQVEYELRGRKEEEKEVSALGQLVIPFTRMVTLEADHISEADFKFTFEFFGFWVT